MKKKILSLVLILSLAMQCGLVTTYASGLDPYIGFSATAIDDYKCDRASFTTSKKLGGIWAGDWACYKDLDFGDTPPNAVEVSVGVPEGYSKAVELRIDSPEGPRIASVAITPSGAFSTPVVCRAELEREITGIHDLYITNANSTSDIYELKFFKPKEPGADIPKFDNSDVYTDIADDANRRAINILYQLDILRDYEEDKFDPQLPVTRGEFAYSIFKLYGIEDAEGVYNTKFTDVNAEKYYAQAISYLTETGIVNGITADTFRPNDFIRHIDALAVMCRVLDYETLAQELGGYPTGYQRIASDEKFYVSNIGASDYLRRTDMAAMIYKAFDAEALMITGIKNEYTTYEKTEGLLYKTQELYTDFGKVNTNYLTNLYTPETDVHKTEVVIDDNVYDVGITNASAMIGLDCEFFYTEDDNGKRTLRAIIPMSGVKIDEISSDAGNIESITDDEIVYYNSNGKKIRFDIEKDTAVLYNGIAIDDSVENTVSDISDFCGSIMFVENTDGKNTVLIDEYVNYTVNSINIADEFIVDYHFGKKIDLNSENATVFIKKLDDIVTLTELEEGNIVSVYASKNKTGNAYIRVYVISEEISGEISLINSSTDMVVINGVEYRISPYCSSELEVGQSGVFKLDINGYITGYEYASVSDRLVGLYMDSTIEPTGLNRSAKIKLVTPSGSLEALEFADNITVDGIRVKNGETVINGNGSWAGLSVLDTEKPLCYSVNAENKITWMDTLLQGDGGTEDTLKQLTVGDSVTHNYQNGIMAITVKDSSNVSYSVGKYFVPTTATLISYFADSDSEEENWSISTLGNKINDSAYPIGEAYSTFGDDYSSDVFVWRNCHTSTSYGNPFVFTGITTTMDEDGNIDYLVQGIDGLAKVSYVLPGEAYDSGILQAALPGDTVRVKLNAEKEIFAAQYLAFRDGSASRGVSSAAVSENVRLSTGTSREIRWLYGRVDEKGNEYLAIDLGTMNIGGNDETLIELIERSNADVIVVSADGRNGEYTADYGLDTQNVTVNDTVFAYLNDGATKLVVVYKDVIL